MGLSHWIDDAHRHAYRAAYDASLALWPIAYRASFLQTPFGLTHVVSSGDAAGEPIVLLHAASLSAVQWYPQAVALGHRHRLVAVDIMGDIGCSTQTRPIHARVDAAAWLAAVLDALDLERGVLVGSSFGGFLAANLAVREPTRVSALVLLAPAATLQPFATMARLFIRLGSRIALPSAVRPGLRAMMGGSLPDERLVKQTELGVAGFRYDHAGIFPDELPDAELRQIRSRTLVLVGTEERIYDARAAVTRARAVIPEVSAALLPGLGHLPGLQAASAVNDRIVRFLSELG